MGREDMDYQLHQRRCLCRGSGVDRCGDCEVGA